MCSPKPGPSQSGLSHRPNPAEAEALSLDRPQGVLVTAVFEGSPAHNAGLEVSDLGVEIEGKEVIDPNSFGYRFATKMIGETSEFLIVRDGQEVSLSVPLVPAPETVPRDTRELREYSPFEGVTVMNLSPAVAEELGLDGGVFEGVVVASVDRRGAANQVGMRPGDIIRAVNERKVESTRMLEVITKTPPRVWVLEIERNGKVSKLEVR